MKIKKPNPAYAESVDTQAWILAARCVKQDTTWGGMEAAARKELFDTDRVNKTGSYYRELHQLSLNKIKRLKHLIASHLPKRRTLREVPFYLRNYVSTSISPQDLYLPDVRYEKAVAPVEPYEPALKAKDVLHRKRYYIMRSNLDGLVRWPETINDSACTFVVCKTFDEFSFKINARTKGNKLPIVKRYYDLSIHIVAPLEFFNQHFWGLGSHLVVQVLDAYKKEGVSILKTLSCDREDLYVLDQPNVLKTRYYVQQDSRRGTGLTEQAAINSMQYFMGKEIAFTLGE